MTLYAPTGRSPNRRVHSLSSLATDATGRNSSIGIRLKKLWNYCLRSSHSSLRGKGRFLELLVSRPLGP